MAEITDIATGEQDDRVLEEAAAWFLRLRRGEADEADPAYRAWLAASPDHADAMARARIAWGMMGEKANAPEVVTRRRDALDRSAAVARGRWSALALPGRRLRAAAAAAAVAGVAAMLMIWHTASDRAFEGADLYHTAVAETRTVTLADNSRISLDAATRLQVHYSDQSRDITLMAGQAHFQVAKDRLRPFRVTAGDQTVVATGTAFNVELVGEEVLVTLFEGEVVVTDARTATAVPAASPDPAEAAPATRKLKPGQQLIASATAATLVEQAANLEKTDAWRHGKIMLVDDPLPIAVARINRYSRIRLTVADDQRLKALGVSGVFNAGDTDAFVEALEAYFPVQAQRISASLIEIRPRG